MMESIGDLDCQGGEAHALGRVDPREVAGARRRHSDDRSQLDQAPPKEAPGHDEQPPRLHERRGPAPRSQLVDRTQGRAADLEQELFEVSGPNALDDRALWREQPMDGA